MIKPRFDIFNFFKEANGIEIIMPTKLRVAIVAGVLQVYRYIKDEEYVIPHEDFKPFNTTTYKYINNDLCIRVSLKNYYYNLIIINGAEELLNFTIQKRMR
jgi:hypothetical protein